MKQGEPHGLNDHASLGSRRSPGLPSVPQTRAYFQHRVALWRSAFYLHSSFVLGRILGPRFVVLSSPRLPPQSCGTRTAVFRALERAGRVADFLEFGETMCRDALTRDESCGVHFREEHQTPEGEAQREDEDFSHVAIWEWQGADQPPTRHEEALVFEEVEPTSRSYK